MALSNPGASVRLGHFLNRQELTRSPRRGSSVQTLLLLRFSKPLSSLISEISPVMSSKSARRTSAIPQRRPAAR
jgi:hypothetical protein